MSAAKEMEKIADVVLQLLEKEARYRDSDRMLCCKIWAEEIGGVNNLKNISAYDFLCEYAKPNKETKLTNVVSIVRVRRKIQQERIDLRGKNFKGKEAEAKSVKSHLGYRISDDFED
jgi:hypothetical protein